MSSKVWVFLAVTLASIGAGVAVAGVPSRNSADLSDVTSVPEITTAATSVESTPASTETSNEDVDETIPDTATTEPERTATTTTTTSPTESPSATTEPVGTAVDTAPTTRAPIDRAPLQVVVVNGAGIAGVGRETADALDLIGYLRVRTLDGTEIVGTTVVFAATGFQAEAEQLAIDAGLDPALVFPISAVPAVSGLEGEPLVLYLGADIESL